MLTTRRLLPDSGLRDYLSRIMEDLESDEPERHTRGISNLQWMQLIQPDSRYYHSARIESKQLAISLRTRPPDIAGISRQLKEYLAALDFLNNNTFSKQQKTVLDVADTSASVVGAITGETTSILSRLLHPLQCLQKIFPPIAYCVYGIGSFIKGVKKIRQFSCKKSPSAIAYDILSIIADFAVFTLYLLAAGMFLGFLATTGTGFILAAVGTILGWLGNDYKSYCDASDEFQKLQQIREQFPLWFKDGEISAISQGIHHQLEQAKLYAFLGVFMMAGMILLAVNAFVLSAAVPFLGISAITAAGFCLMVPYSLPFIYEGCKWLVGSLLSCCCRKEQNNGEIIVPDLKEQKSSLKLTNAAPVSGHQIKCSSEGVRNNYYRTLFLYKSDPRIQITARRGAEVSGLCLSSPRR